MTFFLCVREWVFICMREWVFVSVRIYVSGFGVNEYACEMRVRLSVCACCVFLSECLWVYV